MTLSYEGESPIHDAVLVKQPVVKVIRAVGSHSSTAVEAWVGFFKK